jgi:hypothetical protein
MTTWETGKGWDDMSMTDSVAAFRTTAVYIRGFGITSADYHNSIPGTAVTHFGALLHRGCSISARWYHNSLQSIAETCHKSRNVQSCLEDICRPWKESLSKGPIDTPLLQQP